MSLVRNVFLHDGFGNPISSHEGALDSHDAHVHHILINRHFIDFDAATENPLVAISVGDTVISVADTTGFTAGLHMVIKDAGGDMREHHFDIISIVVNTSITVDRPIDIAYTTSAILEIVVINMASAAGTLAVPIIYDMGPPSDKIWHIDRVLVSITDNAAMDDSLFGGIAALTNGVVLRDNKVIHDTITNWKSNQHMIEDMYDVTYADKAPADSYGLRARFSFHKCSVAIRLDGSLGETMQILIQDDLTALTTFKMKAQGHIEATS